MINFDKLVNAILETTMASVGMAPSDTVFSSGKVYNDGDSRVASLIGGGKIIKRSQPELLTTTLYKGLKKTTNKKNKKKHHR